MVLQLMLAEQMMINLMKMAQRMLLGNGNAMQEQLAQIQTEI